MKIICILFLFLLPDYAHCKFTTVKVGFIEPIGLTDSTSSIRYRRQFESAIFYGLGLVESKLNKCGYKIIVDTAFHKASDPLAGVSEAQRLLKEKAWVVYGPRRSEDLAKVNKAIGGRITLVGPMAELSEFANEFKSNFSMYPTAKELAHFAFKTAQTRRYGKRFGTVIDASCPACSEFSNSFEAFALKEKFIKVFDHKVIKENTGTLIELKEKVDFVVVPNSSKLSSQIVSTLSRNGLSKKFIGSNGWGDEYFGFFSSYPIAEHIEGFAVRAGLSYELMKLKTGVQSLDFMFEGDIVGPSYSSLGAIHFIRTLASDLCNGHPSTGHALKSYYFTKKKAHFKFTPGLRTVEISKGKLAAGEDVIR